MDKNFHFKEISADEWLFCAKRISSETMSPWIRVSNNIFHSQQWIGKDVITKAKRKYFAIADDNSKIICAFNLYFLSETVVRTRGFFCEPEYRKKGLMKLCLEVGLDTVRTEAKTALAFVSQNAKEFHLKCGFRVIDKWPARKVEYFDFNSKCYKYIENDDITLMAKDLVSRTDLV